MKNIVPKISSSFSKMWNKILNLENSLFPELQESLRIEEFSTKEAKLIRVLDFAEIEKLITITSQTNIPKYREQIARACIIFKQREIWSTDSMLTELYEYYVAGDMQMRFQVNQLSAELLMRLAHCK